jgi:hypothetical protein
MAKPTITAATLMPAETFPCLINAISFMGVRSTWTMHPVMSRASVKPPCNTNSGKPFTNDWIAMSTRRLSVRRFPCVAYTVWRFGRTTSPYKSRTLGHAVDGK